MSLPTYKIHGSERRKRKKELALLKSFVKNFEYNHQLEKDMTSVYGSKINFQMSDEEAQKVLNDKKKEITLIESELNLHYCG